MLIKKYILTEGRRYPVTISDDSLALQAAYAAGGAIVGIWDAEKGGQGDFSSCLYLVTSPEDADEKILERAVRRRHGLPWIIGETKRLIIREFCDSDPLEPECFAAQPGQEVPLEDQLIFSRRDSRKAYIDNRYRFYECGLWALVEKETGEIIGKAGITDKELGYHVYPPYRRKGYALEALREIMRYGTEELSLETLSLRMTKENTASLNLALLLGFSRCEEENGIVHFTCVLNVQSI